MNGQPGADEGRVYVRALGGAPGTKPAATEGSHFVWRGAGLLAGFSFAATAERQISP